MLPARTGSTPSSVDLLYNARGAGVFALISCMTDSGDDNWPVTEVSGGYNIPVQCSQLSL